MIKKERVIDLSKWFFINFFVLLFAFWKILSGVVAIHIYIATIGLLCIFHNWTRHAVYATIRSDIPRKKKIKFAKLTKKVRKYHQLVGTSALVIIIVHACFALYYYRFFISHSKAASGMMALLLLACVVLTGYRRKWKKTRKRQTIHLMFGYAMFIFVVLHLLL